MAPALDLTGSILDRRYRITKPLGAGGMALVYEAVHVTLHQRVAVKVLHPRYAYEARFRERFLQEARVASTIQHPNVVEIKDFGDTPDGSVYFVMEYLQGHDVEAALREHGAMPWPRVRSILLQAASALRAAHGRHIIHRDIKPANCFLTPDLHTGLFEVVKLLDFGIAKVGSESEAGTHGSGLTGTGEVFGTAAYMAPEQARGEGLDARSDLYSLGIMAYEMLAGRKPFTGNSSILVITKHLSEPPVPLRELDPAIPAEVDALVLKMIAKARDDRFASMVALEQALRAIPAPEWTPRSSASSPPPAEAMATAASGSTPTAVSGPMQTAASGPTATATSGPTAVVDSGPTATASGSAASGPTAVVDSGPTATAASGPTSAVWGSSAAPTTGCSRRLVLLGGLLSSIAGLALALVLVLSKDEPTTAVLSASEASPQAAVADAERTSAGVGAAHEAAPDDGATAREAVEAGQRAAAAVPIDDAQPADRPAAGEPGAGADELRADEDEDDVQPPEQADAADPRAGEEPTAPKLPEHETERCAQVREQADAAFDVRNWSEVLARTRQKRCWSSAAQSQRRRFTVRALLELGRFEDCLAAGKRATDAETVKMVEICRKRAG